MLALESSLGGISPCMQPKAARSEKGDVMAEMAKLLVSVFKRFYAIICVTSTQGTMPIAWGTFTNN